MADEIEGLPDGATVEPAQDQSVKGLPPGATLEAVPQTQQVKGLPEGATLEPVQSAPSKAVVPPPVTDQSIADANAPMAVPSAPAPTPQVRPAGLPAGVDLPGLPGPEPATVKGDWLTQDAIDNPPPTTAGGIVKRAVLNAPGVPAVKAAAGAVKTIAVGLGDVFLPTAGEERANPNSFTNQRGQYGASDVVGPKPVAMSPQEQDESQKQIIRGLAHTLAGGGEVGLIIGAPELAGLGTAAAAGDTTAIAALARIGASVGVGAGASYGVGKAADKLHLSPEAKELAQQAAFWTAAGLTGYAAKIEPTKGDFGTKGVKASIPGASADVGFRPAYRQPAPEGGYGEGSSVVPGRVTAGVTVAGRRFGTGPEVRAAAEVPPAPEPKLLEPVEGSKPVQQGPPAVPPEVTTDGRAAGEATAQHPNMAPAMEQATNAHQPVGTEEPQTGRPIVQPTDNPAINQSLATSHMPEFESGITKAIADIPGANLAASRAAKNPERLAEKINGEGKPASTVGDYGAVQISVDSPEARDQTVAAIKNAYPVVVEDDKFEKGDKDYGYRNHSLQVQTPTGGTMEVQIVPKEVMEANPDEHGNYKTAREAKIAGNEDEFSRQAADAKAKNDAAMEKFNARNEVGTSKKSTQGSARDGFNEFMTRVGTRLAREAHGQGILDKMEDDKESPAEVSRQFWEHTYFDMPAEAQTVMTRQLKALTGMEPGDTLKTRRDENGNVVSIHAKDWADIADGLVGDSVEHLEGGERGYVAMMRDANDRFGKDETKPAKSETKTIEGETKYKFGSTQANIPEGSEAHSALMAAAKKIDPADLNPTSYGGDENGLEPDPHVTVRYGVQGEDTAKLEKFIRSLSPFEAKLGKTSAFPPSDSSDGGAVIKADIESPELHRINAEIEKHGDFAPSSFPDYVPHATVAYVKPEAVKKYVGMTETEGKTFPVNSIAITDRNGGAKEIPLEGGKLGTTSEAKGGRGESPEQPAAGGAKALPAPADTKQSGTGIPNNESRPGKIEKGSSVTLSDGTAGTVQWSMGGKARVKTADGSRRDVPVKELQGVAQNGPAPSLAELALSDTKMSPLNLLTPEAKSYTEAAQYLRIPKGKNEAENRIAVEKFAEGRYANVTKELASLPDKLTVYRAVRVPEGQTPNLDDAGIYWSDDPKQAIAHWGDRAHPETILQMTVLKTAVDMHATMRARMRMATGNQEKEITLRKGGGHGTATIYKGDSNAEAPQELSGVRQPEATAKGEDKPADAAKPAVQPGGGAGKSMGNEPKGNLIKPDFKTFKVPATYLRFREDEQNNLDAVRQRFGIDDYPPATVIREPNGGLSIIDGHNRASVARDEGKDIPVISIPRDRYDDLVKRGFDDMEISAGMLDEANESEAWGNLVAQFNGSRIASRSDDVREALGDQEDSIIQSAKSPAASGPGAEPVAGVGTVKPGAIGEMPSADLRTDPKRFQYKLNTDSSGASGKLKEVKWNPELSGILTAWTDPADGVAYVVNGHHRLERAEASGQDGLFGEPIESSPAAARKAADLGSTFHSGFLDPELFKQLFPDVVARMKEWLADEVTPGDDQRAVMRQTRGEMDRRVAVVMQKLSGQMRDWRTRPRQESIDLWNAVEGGKVASLPAKDQALANLFKGAFDKMRGEIQQLKPEALQNYIENYFPHLWDRPSAVSSTIKGMLTGKRPFAGKASFLKQRTIPTMQDGLDLGFKPKTWNPVESFMLKYAEMAQFLMGHQTLQMMKEAGTAKYVGVGQKAPDDWTQLDDRIASVYRRVKITDEDAINDATYNMRKGAGTRTVPAVAVDDIPLRDATVLAGHYYAPADAAKVFNNFVSRGLAGRSGVYDVLNWMNQNLNALQLGISAFHAATTSINAATSDVALGIQQLSEGKPLQAGVSLAKGAAVAPSIIKTMVNGSRLMREYLTPGSYAKMSAEANALADAGARVKQNSIEIKPLNRTINAWRNGAVREGLTSLPAAILDATTRPVMEYYVPRMKVGAFYAMAHDILDQAQTHNWPKEKTRAKMQQAWDSVDNRFGQMVYDNLFWPKALRDTLQLATRSVGWNFGDVRELGGGLADTVRAAGKAAQGEVPEVTPRMAFAYALPIVSALIGGVLTYLWTGERPQNWKDYFYPRTADGTRHSIPGYMKDVFAFAHAPVQTTENKMGPLWSMTADAINNRDFYGTEIRHKDDSPLKQVGEFSSWAAKQALPFSMTGSGKLLEQHGAEPTLMGMLRAAMQHPGDLALGQAGFQQAPAFIQNSAALNAAREYGRDNRPPGTKTEAQSDHLKAFDAVVKMYRTGHVDHDQVERYRKEGLLPGNSVQRAALEARFPPIVMATRSLSVEQALNVYEKGTDAEKSALRPVIARKFKDVRDIADPEKKEEVEAAYHKAMSEGQSQLAAQ